MFYFSAAKLTKTGLTDDLVLDNGLGFFFWVKRVFDDRCGSASQMQPLSVAFNRQQNNHLH